jgi:trk system potassium uptake protein TrkA
MHVVIGGFGRVGRYLAHMLEGAGHTVAVIDRSSAVFEEYGEEIRGRKLAGEVFDRGTLIKAGIEKADVFAAVTSGDNSNIISARVARERFNVPHVVARIFDPRRAQLYRELGIPTISTVEWTTQMLLAMIVQPGLRVAHTFGDGEVTLIELQAGSKLVGKSPSEVTSECGAVVTVIVRDGIALQPTSSTFIERDDLLFMTVGKECMEALYHYLDQAE